MQFDLNRLFAGRENGDAAVSSSFIINVYKWMAAGLAVTAAVSFAAASSPAMIRFLFMGSSIPFYLLIGAELVLVFVLSAKAMTLEPSQAGLLFFIYAGLNGLTLSPIVIAYTGASLTSTFITCAGMFGASAAYGTITKRDLSGLGSFCMMGVFGLIIAGVINLFIGSAKMDLVTSVMGVIIFTVLVAYDINRIRDMAIEAEYSGNEAGLTIICALRVYLDFINMFIYLLRLMGKRKR